MPLGLAGGIGCVFEHVLKSPKCQHLEVGLWTACPIGKSNKRNQVVWGSKFQQWEKEMWVKGTKKIVLGESTAYMCMYETSKSQQLERPGCCFYFCMSICIRI